ncbi:MAG: hypothetical protein M1514_02995 [Patescibacteria group bacterium]|nr:hypothetical protein [Patescibacteria group bacterium]
MRKYDWLKLRQEFITGNWLSVANFFRDKNIPSNSRTRTKARGWQGARGDYLKQIISQAQQKAVESEVDIRLRQQKDAKLLQKKGLEKLSELEINNIEEARRLITSGLEQERLALGLDKNITATQVNITPPGKTRLDKLIEKASYEEILQMIAELKQLKAEPNLST